MQVSCFNEARRGVVAVIHEPAIEPTVLLYLLKSFNLNKMASHWSKNKSVPLGRIEKPPLQQERDII